MNFSVDIEEYFKMSDGNVLLIGMKEDCPTRERLCCLVWCCVMLCLAIATVQMNHQKTFLGYYMTHSITFPNMS